MNAAADVTAKDQQDERLEPRLQRALREMLTSNWLVTLAALLLALVVSGVLIAAADEDVHTTASYLFARPADFFSAVWDSVWSAYVACSRVRSSTRAPRPSPGRSAR